MKINYNTYLVFITIVLLFSCEVPYRDNVRLLIKGQVLDENSQPISDANISVYAREGVRFFTGTLTTLLEETVSSADGSFSIIMLLAEDENFAIDIAVNDDYSRYQYRTNTLDFTTEDYLIDLGLVPLRRKSIINYNITRDNSASEEFTYTFSYPSTQCVEVFTEGELDEEETLCYETITNTHNLNSDFPDDAGVIITLLGSEVLFTYSVNGQPEESQSIIINQTDNVFNFSY